MISFEPIASGSSGNASLLRGGGVSLLIDAGLTAKELQRKGLTITNLTACLITHEHGDHSKGVKSLVAKGVDVYTSQGTIDALGIKSHRLHPIKAGEQFKIGDITILPFGVYHDVSEPLGFLIAHGAGKLLFVTDTGYLAYRFKDLTHICIEANYSREILMNNIGRGDLNATVGKRTIQNHLSIEQVIRTIWLCNSEKLKEVYLMHLSNGNSDEGMFKRSIQALTGMPVNIS